MAPIGTLYQCQQKTSFLVIASLTFSLLCSYTVVANPLYIVSAPDAPLEKNAHGFYKLHPSVNSSGHYKKAAVATSSHQCAEIGAKMLRLKGSAVDATIATLLCDGIISLQGLGIGGGFLMTIWNATEQKAYFLNAREYAPAAAPERLFTEANQEEAKIGAKAIGIPGEIAGYWAAHQRFGKLPWATLFEDAIKICEEGFNVMRYTVNCIREVEDKLARPQFSSLKSILASSYHRGSLVDVGEKIKNQKLAETLKKIRDHGRDIFYKGEIAKNLVTEIQAAGGIITLDDFANYEVQWKEPISTTINGKTMYSAPTPGSGAILGFMLNILQKLIPAPNKNVMYQRIAEVFKWGYARRAELGDFIERPEYANKKYKADCRISPKEVEQYKKNGYAFVERDGKVWDKDCLIAVDLKNLLDKNYADKVLELIKDDKTYNDYEHYNITKAGKIDLGTSHASVYAEDGSAVSVTSTINQVMGSLVRSESTGIILNDQMDDYCYPGIKNGFGVEPSEFNFVRNGTSYLRPMSSMSPTIILNEDKTVRLVIGAAGGTKITTGVTLGIINNLLLNKSIKETIDAPRIHHNLWPMAVQKEDDFDPEVVKYLSSVGHNITGWLIMTNTLAAIAVNGPNDITASGDFRREGRSAGY